MAITARAACAVVSWTGINTGPCITGDADCDGDAGAASVALQTQSGLDNPRLDVGEFALFIVDFGPSNTAPFNRSELVAIGKPAGASAGEETLDTVRAARHGLTAPRNAFGLTIPGVTVTVFNMPGGPDSGAPHLELAVTPYSTIPAALGLQCDPVVGCIAFAANIGSIDDGDLSIWAYNQCSRQTYVAHECRSRCVVACLSEAEPMCFGIAISSGRSLNRISQGGFLDTPSASRLWRLLASRFGLRAQGCGVVELGRCLRMLVHSAGSMVAAVAVDE